MGEHELHQQGVRTPKPEEEVKPLTREEIINARVTELCDTNTRRELEEMARNMGFEPTKTEYPNMESLARAIAEKENPPEEVESGGAASEPLPTEES